MKKHIIIVGTVFLLGTVAYGAMVVGYFLGGANYTARFAPADAAQTVAVLGRLRKGEIDSATLFSFIPMIRTRYPRARIRANDAQNHSTPLPSRLSVSQDRRIAPRSVRPVGA